MKIDLEKVRINILLALVVNFCFVAIEQVYRIYNDILAFNLTFVGFVEQFVIHLLLISIISRRAILIVYGFLLVLVWFQLLHFGYFGTWIFPLEYLLFFTQFQETYDTFITVTDIAILPTISILIAFLTIYKLINIYEDKRLKIRYLSMVLILFVIFIPARVYVEDMRKGHRPHVEHYAIKNTFNTVGYLLGSIIPKNLVVVLDLNSLLLKHQLYI